MSAQATRGFAILRDKTVNRSIAFTSEERERLARALANPKGD